MGKQARVRKERLCRTVQLSTSEDLRAHAALCARAIEAGLVLPSPSHSLLILPEGESDA